MNRSKLYLSSALWVVLFAIPLVLGSFAVDPITGAEDAEGYGADATGGYGQTVTEVSTFSSFLTAWKAGNRYIKLTADLSADGYGTQISSMDNITIDGQGVYTLWGDPDATGQRMIEMIGENIVIKDIHVRNSADNVSFKAPANTILMSHVTTSGSYDDGISISYGTTDVTVQYCAFFGNTRSCFIKYDAPARISLHHNWFKAQWIRGPWPCGSTYTDCRNNLQEDWSSWGGPRFEAGATGNCINSTFILTGVTAGKSDGTCYIYGTDPNTSAYFDGNAFTNCYPRDDNRETEVSCAYVTTQSAGDSEDNVRANAGCLPRDSVDMEYITATSWPTVGDYNPWRVNPANLGPAVWVYGPESPTSSSPITFEIEFTASVTGLTAAEITVTNGTKGSLSGSGASYTLPVTPSSEGAVTCYVPDGVAQDSSSRDNYESNVCSVTYQTGGGGEDFGDWDHRATLTFDGYTGGSTLANFPVLVRLDTANFPANEFEANGADLRFADSSGDPLDYEIEAWNTNNEHLIWVKVPSISSTTTYIRMYWGKSGAPAGANPTGVWSNGYLGTWHLNGMADSTSNDRDATNNGASSATGLIGSGLSFDGNDYVSIPTGSGSSSSGSMAIWVKTSYNFTDLGHVFYMRGAGGSMATTNGAGDGKGGQNELHINFESADTVTFFIEGTLASGDVILTSGNTYNDGSWHHMAATWDVSGNAVLYIDGSSVASTAHNASEFNFDQFIALGRCEKDVATRYYNGHLDEARQESAVRSADWVKASYDNQKASSTFIDIVEDY